MLIEKEFSSYDDYGYEDERVYSVLMDEDELRLYSEFLEEREYASIRDTKKAGNTANRIGEKIAKLGGISFLGDNSDEVKDLMTKRNKYAQKYLEGRRKAGDKIRHSKTPASTGLKKAYWLDKKDKHGTVAKVKGRLTDVPYNDFDNKNMENYIMNHIL